MAKGVTIDVEMTAVTIALQRLSAADMKTANEAIGAAIVASTKTRFERQQSPEGKPWGRLKPRTAAQRIGKHRRGFDNILRVSNRLYDSISHLSDAESVLVGTNQPYAAIHQFGGTINRAPRDAKIYQNYNPKTGDLSRFTKPSRANFERNVRIGAYTITIPARPYLGISEDDKAEIVATYENVYRTAFEGS